MAFALLQDIFTIQPRFIDLICLSRFRYFVHYPAWNKKWDEWVPEAEVLKPTGENRNKQKSTFENAKMHQSGGKRKSTGILSHCWRSYEVAVGVVNHDVGTTCQFLFLITAGGEEKKAKGPATPKAETPSLGWLFNEILSVCLCLSVCLAVCLSVCLSLSVINSTFESIFILTCSFLSYFSQKG